MMTSKTYLVLASLAVTAALTSACGMSGSLEKAAPMWGPDRVAYEAEQAKKEEERKAAEAARVARNTGAAPAPVPAPAPKN